VRVAQRRVGEEQTLFAAHPLGESFRAHRLKPLAHARRRRRGEVHLRQRRFRQLALRVDAALHIGAAVHDHAAEI
jgi:hypothetical protein